MQTLEGSLRRLRTDYVDVCCFAPYAPLLLLAPPALGSRVPEAARAWAVGAWAMVILSFAVGALFEAFFAPS